MNIKNNEGMSAVLLGISGATQWVSKFSKKAVQWVKSKLLGIKSFLSGIKNFLGDAKNKGKKLLNFFKNWFDDDPIGATAGGALVLIVGGIVLLKGAAIGAIGSGGLAAIAKLGSIGGAVAATAKTAIAFAFKNKIISFIGTTIFGGIIANSASFLTNVQFIYNFDWNISVESIRASQQAAMMRVVNQLGETAGMALGGLVCSALPGMAQVEVNPQIFARTWYLVNDDVKEEILDSYADLILAAKNAAKFMAFLETFKNTRDFIRNNVRTGFKGIDDKISKWGLEGKPWILSEKFEEAVESIPNNKVREFTENVLGGFIETCGMIHPQMNVISV